MRGGSRQGAGVTRLPFPISKSMCCARSSAPTGYMPLFTSYAVRLQGLPGDHRRASSPAHEHGASPHSPTLRLPYTAPIRRVPWPRACFIVPSRYLMNHARYMSTTYSNSLTGGEWDCLQRSLPPRSVPFCTDQRNAHRRGNERFAGRSLRMVTLVLSQTVSYVTLAVPRVIVFTQSVCTPSLRRSTPQL